MNSAEIDKHILDQLMVAVSEWRRLFMSDPVNVALNMDDHIRDHLVKLRRVRWYAIGGAAAVEKLWKGFVEVDVEGLEETKNATFDFYMNGATYMWMTTPVVHTQRESFIQHICETLSWVRSSPLVPTHVTEYAHDYEAFKLLLKDNHWILFMILLSMCPVDQ